MSSSYWHHSKSSNTIPYSSELYYESTVLASTIDTVLINHTSFSMVVNTFTIFIQSTSTKFRSCCMVAYTEITFSGSIPCMLILLNQYIVFFLWKLWKTWTLRKNLESLVKMPKYCNAKMLNAACGQHHPQNGKFSFEALRMKNMAIPQLSTHWIASWLRLTQYRQVHMYFNTALQRYKNWTLFELLYVSGWPGRARNDDIWLL